MNNNYYQPNSFKNWWSENKNKAIRIGNLWFLPKKLKLIVRIIIAAIEVYLTTEADSTRDTVQLKDVNVNNLS